MDLNKLKVRQINNITPLYLMLKTFTWIREDQIICNVSQDDKLTELLCSTHSENDSGGDEERFKTLIHLP